MSENKKISDLIPDPKNANKGTQRGLRTLDDSLRKYGAGRSILIDKDNRIIAGNKTAERAADIGLEDVIIVESDGTKLVAVKRTDLTDEQARMLAYYDNRAGELDLSWDAEALQLDLDAGLDLSGLFDNTELLDIGVVFEQPPDDPGAQVNKADELREKWQTETGQLWRIPSKSADGEHRIVCGDCTDREVVARVMDGEKAQFCFTDPPYGVKYTGGTKKWTMLENDDDVNMYAASLPIIHEFTDEKSALYLCFASLLSLSVFSAVRDANYIPRSVIVWSKNHAQFGSYSAQYKQKHETILYCHKRGETPYWYGPNNEVSVWEIDRESANEYHPTQKPVEMYERAMTNSAPIGCIVIEPFLGSGACIVACERLGRLGRGVEISPAYVAVSLQRLADMGLEPYLAE